MFLNKIILKASKLYKRSLSLKIGYCLISIHIDISYGRKYIFFPSTCSSTYKFTVGFSTVNFIIDIFRSNIFVLVMKTNHYDNLKRKKSNAQSGQPAKSTAKPIMHDAKVMLCNWWNRKCALY